MSQELLSKQTDLIDRFGVLQIKLSNRSRRNREFIHIFDKNSRFSKVKDDVDKKRTENAQNKF